MYIFILVLSVILSVCSWVITWKVCNAKVVGVLRIDESDPDEPPHLYLEINSGVGNFMANKFVTFEVNTKSYISSQK